MNFKVDYWDNVELRFYYHWFFSLKDAIAYIEEIEQLENVGSIRVSQILYER